MLVRFWGVRGSTPTPQQENMRYGGNTPCVEVRLNGRIYVFDCGTGFRNLGRHLAREFAGGPIEANVFLSHFHWDHIQGIPFFGPLYSPENSFTFHASCNTGPLQKALESQMIAPYFPVEMGHMAAHRQYCELQEGKVEFRDCTVEICRLNHPQDCLGFRLECDDGVFVYATDNEPGVPELDKALRRLAEGADVLIYDAQYLPEDYYARRRGWGHSHWREAVDVAAASGARQLVLYHHDPDHTDTTVDAIVDAARRHHSNVCAAAEGVTLTVKAGVLEEAV